jgi:hypothetical protein
VQVVTQRTDVVDTDHLAQRLEDVEVRVRARPNASLVAEERGRERECGGPLPHAGRPVQQVRVRSSVR